MNEQEQSGGADKDANWLRIVRQNPGRMAFFEKGMARVG